MTENFPEVIIDINLCFQVEEKKPRYRYIIVELWNSKDKKIPKVEKKNIIKYSSNDEHQNE